MTKIILIPGLVLFWIGTIAFTVTAQDPFADPPAGGMPPAGGAAEVDPFGPGGAPPGAQKPGEAPVSANQRDPLVIQQIRDSNPTTPAELLRAAHAALQFGRPDETKRYLGLLLAAQPGEDLLAPLAGEYGDFLLQITRVKEVQPEGQRVADALLAASRKLLQDPGRLDALIAQLSDAELGTRQSALGELSKSGSRVVTPLLRVLADPAREQEHRNIRAALGHLGPNTELPLLGALEIPTPALQSQVMLILGRIGSTKAILHLVRPAVDDSLPPETREAAIAALTKIVGRVPDRYEAERYLADQTARLLQGDLPYQADYQGLVELWSWDAAERQLVPQKLPARDAAALLAARAAADLYALRSADARDPSDQVAADTANRALRLKLLTSLEVAKVLAGLDRPLPMTAGTPGAEATAAGYAVVSQVLADAMQLGQIPAAIAAAEVLGQIGNSEALYLAGGQPSPLAEAMTHPDRRVRLAAALAGVKLDRGESFPGASRMTDALGWIAGSGGQTLVLVANARSADAQDMVGLMNELGYDAAAAYVGRHLAVEAFANPDVEFILISDAIDLPPVRELVQWLRRDFRTARTPIGVMASTEKLDAARFAFSNDPLTTVFPRLESAEIAASEIARLRGSAGRDLVGYDERIDQARAALAALASLAAKPQNIARFELLRHEAAILRALNHPALAADAASLLGMLGSPRCQTALVDFASESTRSLAERQSAAAAFADAVKHRGVMLTQRQVAEQYVRYNASAALDKPTQDLLGSILDAIEAPAVARGDLTRVE